MAGISYAFYMLEAKDLAKHYGKIIALESLSFQLQKGEVLGLLGPNGAGKSTAMRMICGTLSATSGEVFFMGEKRSASSLDQAKSAIGYLPENAPLYMDMDVESYLCFCAEIKGKQDIKKLVSIALQKCGLEEVRRKNIQLLSKGYKQRVGIAQAIVHNPKIIVLDEPTIGLDPKQVSEIRQLIRNLASEATIIISSHILTEMQMLCDRVIVLNKGKVLANKSMQELNQMMQEKYRYEITLKHPVKEQDLPQLKNLDILGNKILFDLKEEEELNATLKYLIDANQIVVSAKKQDFDLEDAYLSILGEQ
tara:strand:- start:3332 stop:4255 length:924 start_codon:yes stop_codon:yes gene_type:complete